MQSPEKLIDCIGSLPGLRFQKHVRGIKPPDLAIRTGAKTVASSHKIRTSPRLEYVLPQRELPMFKDHLFVDGFGDANDAVVAEFRTNELNANRQALRPAGIAAAGTRSDRDRMKALRRQASPFAVLSISWKRTRITPRGRASRKFGK
jgi:hypothetical protein